MSIVAYVGLPRSGKSYTAVEQVILPALRLKRTVVTNIPLKFDLVRRDFPGCDVREFAMSAVLGNPDSITDLCPNGAVVVLDEVWRLWPAGKKVDKIPEAFKSFLAEHGHRVDGAGNAQQVVLVTQDLAQIAAFARQLVEQTFMTKKLGMVGLQKKFRTDVYQGNPTGQTPPQGQQVRQIFGRYEPRVYQYYVSHTMSEAAEGTGANEKALDGRGNVWTRPVVFLAPVLVLGMCWFGFSHLWGERSKLQQRKAAPPAAVGRAAAPPASVPPGYAPSGSLRRAETRPEDLRRLLLEVVDGARSYVVLADGPRLVEVESLACQHLGRQVRCAYKGGYYDSAGYVGPVSQAPLR